jgi:hypothetical protein
MTRNQIRRRLNAAFAVLVLFVAIAVLFRVHLIPLLNSKDERVGYGLLKDLAPLLLGVVAVFLANWYQQRMAFLVALRACWSHLIDARTSMHAYLSTPDKSAELYGRAYREISRAIDEVRTVYRNVGEDADHIGWYPYEPVNDMLKAFESVADDHRENAATAADQVIWDAWQAMAIFWRSSAHLSLLIQ